MSRLTPVSGLLRNILRQYGLEGKLREYQLAQRWEEIVGQTIAGHTYPEAIRFKKLILRVDSSVWMQQLSFFKKDLVEKVNNAFESPLIQDIQLRIGTIGDRPTE
ncbi:MAG: DUF721 domain-containing protein [Nitrospirae bacterium]|nr:DUF721 domain-containing protein [Nitrospirota bacterium]